MNIVNLKMNIVHGAKPTSAPSPALHTSVRVSLPLPPPGGPPGPGSPHSGFSDPVLVRFSKCSNPLRPGQPQQSRERIRSDVGGREDGCACVPGTDSQDVMKAPPYLADPGSKIHIKTRKLHTSQTLTVWEE